MKIRHASSLNGRVPLSGDKSIAHRALLLGALARGTTRIANVPHSDDLAATRRCLEALGVPVESQLLVFSKTGVQRALTSPHNPRALFYDESVVVGYVPGAPALEIAAHDTCLFWIRWR